MTTYDLYRYIFIGGLALSIISLAASVFIFFFFNIKNVIGDLSGSNAKKAIEDIKNQTKAPAKKKKTTSTPTGSFGITAETRSTTKISVQDRYDHLSPEEEATDTQPSSETTVLNDAAETSVLSASETTVLNDSSETSVLNASETTVLNSQETTNITSNETTVLNTPKPVLEFTGTAHPGFTIEVDITYVHSDEVIK